MCCLQTCRRAPPFSGVPPALTSPFHPPVPWLCSGDRGCDRRVSPALLMLKDLKRCSVASRDGTASGPRANSRLQDTLWDPTGLELEMEPRVGRLGASHEEDEGLKKPGWGVVGSGDGQEDALTCPSCSWMSLSWLKERRRQGTSRTVSLNVTACVFSWVPPCGLKRSSDAFRGLLPSSLL